MSIDKFGRYLNTSYSHLTSGGKNSYSLKLPFSLTAENDLNFLNKRLINIGFPRASSDCVTKEYVDQFYTGLLQQQQDDLRKIRDSINKLENENRELANKISELEERQDVKRQHVTNKVQTAPIDQQEEVTSDITALKHRFRI